MADPGINAGKLYDRYQGLQRYLDWTDEDARRIRAAFEIVRPCFVELVDDFHNEIRRHPEALRVVTGGAQQTERLKRVLCTWLAELFSGNYDEQYVVGRWRVGLRHVEIGLDQVYTNMALSRLRRGLLRSLQIAWHDSLDELRILTESINKLLDLDLAIIEDAYQSAYREQEQRTERLITIGQIAGGVAHELRNPLNVVKTSIYYLLNAKNPSTEKKNEHLQRIERQVGLADKVITALSDFATLPFPQVRLTRIGDCVAESLELASLPPEISVAFESSDMNGKVKADPDQLRIVLTNLLRNARDAMPRGGRLLIAVAEVDHCTEIAISDTGVGIPSGLLARIMQPLYSTKSRGMGLGLAISRAIVEKHHGQLLVSSEEGKGSTFTVRLPGAHMDPN